MQHKIHNKCRFALGFTKPCRSVRKLTRHDLVAVKSFPIVMTLKVSIYFLIAHNRDISTSALNKALAFREHLLLLFGRPTERKIRLALSVYL